MEYVKTGTLTCHATTLANIDKQIGFVPNYVKVWNPKTNIELEWAYGMLNGSAKKNGDFVATTLRTSPKLVIGSTPANLANVAFTYEIGGMEYAKAAVAAGTALTSGAPGTVPQNKYGLFGLEIGTDGTIANLDAADNATGYATEALAIAALTATTAAHVLMGYVTVIRTGGTFIGATTSLADATTTAKYYSMNGSTAAFPQTLGITPLDNSTTGQGFRVGLDTDLQGLGDTLYYWCWR
jgi:hypothetical protein